MTVMKSIALHFYCIVLLRVYCKYHYLEDHEFFPPELELRHFLGKMVQADWKWSEQYGEDEKKGETEEGCKLSY